PNPGDKVSVNSGNNQRGSINQPLPHPFVAVVTDSGANVIQNVQVEFAVTRGGGQFQNGSTTYTTQTDSDGRASAQLTLGTEVGMDNHRVTATLVGTSLNAGFTASAFVPADPGNTRISGVVLDNQDTPLPGVTIRVDGTTRQSVTDTQGRFTITEVPVGPVHLLADGSTTSVPGEWPTLSYNIVTIAGVDNPLSAPIYLVRLNTTNATLAGREDVEITIPEVPGFKLEVRAGSVTFPDGSREGLVSATPVNASKVPMAPPNGMQPQFIVTIQPAGTRFDPPAKITMPNVDGHLPGAQVEMYSYDHDLEEFVSIGLGTVSLDGSVIKSNTGVGIIKAGWFCSSVPIPSSCVGSCPICQGIVAACTECQNVSDDPRLIDTPGDCKVPYCSNGQADTAPNLFDEPANPCETCSADGEKIHVVEPIPVLRVPEPSAYPPHDVIDFVGTLRPDHRDDVWGEQYTDIEFTFRCRPYCESGSQRFVITGDITPGPGWRVNVYSQMQARQDIFGQDVVNCSIEPVPLEIIGSTILHELKHSNAYIDLMNRYKTRFATGVRYNSQAECDAAFNPIYSEYDNDLRLLNEREEAHSNYCGDPQYGLYCDQTNTTVTYLRGRYCQ
ncbi:MAG: carboxypeptidase regulatory-like domain-containing protein, partial [Gammaproteobacteria bacterium]|nr:carboxypeptidase regulatory-like domain-containing protein [Gammaproteobacteria bacterium]